MEVKVSATWSIVVEVKVSVTWSIAVEVKISVTRSVAVVKVRVTRSIVVEVKVIHCKKVDCSGGQGLCTRQISMDVKVWSCLVSLQTDQNCRTWDCGSVWFLCRGGRTVEHGTMVLSGLSTEGAEL